MDIETMLKQEQIHHLHLRPSVVVEAGTSIGDVINKMQDKRVTSILVVDKDHLKGIFTERDVLKKVMHEDVELSEPIDTLMTPDPVTLTVDATLKDAIQLMVEGGYRNIPVIENENDLVGNLTVNDIVNYIVDHFPEEVYNLPPRLHQIAYSPHGA